MSGKRQLAESCNASNYANTENDTMQTESLAQNTTSKQNGQRRSLPVEKKFIPMISRIEPNNLRVILHRKANTQFGWRMWKNEKNIYFVDLLSIPDYERKSYGFPDLEKIPALLAELQLEAKAKENQKFENELIYSIDQISYEMKIAMLDFQKYFNLINDKYQLPKDKIKDFAQKCAVWEWINKTYTRTANSGVIYYNAYSRLFPGHLKERNSFDHFKSACKNDVFGTVIDKRALTKAPKRITTFQYTFLQQLYIQPNKITPPEAYRKLTAACTEISEKPYSLASVKNYYREFEKNAELFALRYGAAAAQKQLPYASLAPASHRNTQWQMDGWNLPFYVAYGDTTTRFVLYMVRDNHSRKIIGWSLGATENTTVILDAMENAMRTTGVFPAELVSDKHSFHKTLIATRLKAETEKMGAVWTITINAQRNQLAERYNQYLDTICKDYEGYTGKNMTAKGKDARPSQEHQTRMYKPANWKTEEEIKAIAIYVVTEFNRTKLDLLDGLSPNEKFEASEEPKCFKISENDRIELLRPATAYKVTRGQITIKVGLKKHEFLLPAALIDRFNNRELLVVYEDLNQAIYLSDPKTGEQLGSIKPKQRIHGAIADQTEADKRLINQMTGKTNGVTVKARKTAQQRIVESYKDNPEVMQLIDAYTVPKDIRKMANEDFELKRALRDENVKIDMVPLRDFEPAHVPEPVTTRKSPFAPKNLKIEALY